MSYRRRLFAQIASFALAVSGFAGAHAQAVFQPLSGPGSSSYTVAAGTMPQSAAVADFNHDGYADLVVANKASNTIDVYFGTASGKFAAPTSYPTCGGPTAALAQDLDLTGLPDIVITCNTPTSNVIEVFLNLGNGTFNPVVDGMTNIVLGTGAGPVALTSGDFNNDGHPDLAVADSLDGTITLFLSNPANNFTYYTVKTLSGYGSPMGITAGHFGTSGNMGLAVTDASASSVHILTGDGHGGFSNASAVTVGTQPTGITQGDFNHDGKLDLAVANAGSGNVSVLLGQGNGAFTAESPISVGPSTGTGATSIVAVDTTGDGNLDLATGNPLQGNFAVLTGNGDGTFAPADFYQVPNGPAFVTVGDFNRNGKPDLAVTESTGGMVAVLLDNTLPTPVPGGRSFTASASQTAGNGNMADSVATGDFNHDGFQDIAVSYLEDNAVRVLPGNGRGGFGPAVMYAVGANPYQVVSGDLNNDGYKDLVTVNTSVNSKPGSVSVLMNKGDGSGTFMPAQSYNVGWLPYGVAIGDLNGDGIADLAVTNYGDSTISILYGQAGGGFTTGQTLTACTNPYGVVIGDFRHSGQNDVAVTCYHTAQLEVFLNEGMHPFQAPPPQTTFASPLIYSTDLFPTSLVIGDFNRDGNLDIVTGNSIANDMSFFAGNGDGTFKAGVTSPSINFPDSIAAADFNGDGILDIVGVVPNGNSVAVSLGNGDGTFSKPQLIASPQQPWAVAVADFNGDGKPDFVTANTYNRVNLTVPAYQQMYMKEFPPVSGGVPSVNSLLNASGTAIRLKVTPSGNVNPRSNVTLTATLTGALGGATPTGSVRFADTDGTATGALPLSGGTASLTVSNLGSGYHQFTVLYSGDVLYQPRTTANAGPTVTVSGTAVSLSFNPNPVKHGTPFSYTVTVGSPAAGQPNPIGTISIYEQLANGRTLLADGPNPIGTAGTGGVSTFTKNFPNGAPAGSYYLFAVFTPAPGSRYARGSSPQVLLISQ